ncbi:MAG: M28 family peptidase [Polyangiaceae bacterium]|nr:M28 family peptidase [Polyangiaceae bacterium]
MTAPDPKARRAPPRPVRRRRRRAIGATLGLLAALFLADQLGVRRLSGADFPPRDPMALVMRAEVEQLASPAWGGRRPGTPGNAEAARWLAAQMEAAGLSPLPSIGGYLSPLPRGPSGQSIGDNVIGYLPAPAGPAAEEGASPPTRPSEFGAEGGSTWGRVPEPHRPAAGATPERPDAGPAGVIVLGAHFDHVGETAEGVLLGADDNASAVAVLLGAARALRDRPRRLPIVVVFFNTEEAPYFGTPLQGSRELVRALPAEIGSPAAIRLAVVLDLIGGVVWRPSADTIFACGAEKSEGLPALVDGVREAGLDVRRLGLHMVENIPGYQPSAFSDYDVFRERGVPFLFLSSGRTPRYHRPTDLPDTLHYDRMARTARWIASLAAGVDARARPFAFDPAAEDLAGDAATMRWAMDAAASPLRSVPGTGPITALRLLGDRSRVHAMAAPDHAFTAEDARSLERASFRLQCLLYSFPACFTF